jgi:pterin-4a-carbinolamine dehydratase
VVGKFLYNARAVDGTMLHALNTLASWQTKGTQVTVQATTEFLNYYATHPDAVLRYHRSDMELYTHSNTGYLTELEAQSRAGGHHYFGK